jgi:hypothetical protein
MRPASIPPVGDLEKALRNRGYRHKSDPWNLITSGSYRRSSDSQELYTLREGIWFLTTRVSIAGKQVNQSGCQDCDKQGLNSAPQPGYARDAAKKNTEQENQQQRDRHGGIKWGYR